MSALTPTPSRPILSIAVYVRDGDAVGDALIKIPFLGTLKATFPQAEIHWIAGKGRSTYGTTLKSLVTPLIKQLHDDSRIGNRWRDWVKPPQLDQHDILTPFDLLIDTQCSLRTSLLVKRIPHRCYISSTAGWMLSDIKPNRGDSRPDKLIDRLLQLISLAAGRPISLNYSITVPKPYDNLARRLLPEGKHYVGLVPGAGKAIKQWPLERFIAVGRRLHLHGYTPVFFLGPNEVSWRDTIAASLPTAHFPECDIPENNAELKGPILAIALAKRLCAALSNDCGTAHMLAVAYKTPIISLFGPTNPHKFPPACQYAYILTAQEFGGKEMAHIPEAAVWKTLWHTLNTHHQGQPLCQPC